MHAPKYDDIVYRLKTDKDERFLDLGCCFGVDLRQLVSIITVCFLKTVRLLIAKVYDGVPSDQIWAIDLESGFFDLGYSFFRDKETIKANFVAADILAENVDNPQLDELENTFSFIHASAFFHLFTWGTQIHIAARCLRFLRKDKERFDGRPRRPVIFGHQAGAKYPGEYARPEPGQLNSKLVDGQHQAHNSETVTKSDKKDNEDGQTLSQVTRYRHNADSWRRMWEQFGKMSGTRWTVEVEQHDIPKEMIQSLSSEADAQGETREYGTMTWLKYACWLEEWP